MEREAIVWNCSRVNTWKETVLHRTVPIHRVDGKPIRTYAERFHTEPFQSSRANTALDPVYTRENGTVPFGPEQFHASRENAKRFQMAPEVILCYN